MSESPQLPMVGWREWVGLPSLGTDIKAKVDTGALSSAIHAFDVEEYVEDGCCMVSFRVCPEQRRSKPSILVEAEVVDRRPVRDSGGKQENRIVVLFDLELGGARWTTEVTLTRRDQMGFRMLLGRRALRHRFLVDPGGSFHFGEPHRRTHRK